MKMSKNWKEWEFSKTVVLPFTKVKAKITMPSWAARTAARESVIEMGQQKDDSAMTKLLLYSCCTIEDQPIDPGDLDLLPMHDVAYLFDAFMAWENGDEAPKNELPTGK